MLFIVRRLVFYLVAAWVALTINFFIPRLMPGNAVQSIMSKFPNLQPSAYRALEALLQRKLDRFGHVVLLCAHSMPSEPRPARPASIKMLASVTRRANRSGRIAPSG